MAWRKPANLNEWFGILLRHKKKFFYPAIIVMIVAIWASQWMEREYQADAKFQRVSDNTSKNSADDPIGDAYTKIRALMNYNFKGRNAVEQLIKDLGLTKDIPHTADGALTTDGMMMYNDLINRLSNAINVNSQVASEQIDLISVSYTDKDRTLVPKVVNKLVENYMAMVRSKMDDTLLEQKKFFDTEVNRYRRKVSDLESQRLRFALNTGGVTPEDPIVVYNKLSELKTEKEKLKAELEKAKAGWETLSKWEKDQPEFIKNKKTSANEDLVALKDKLKTLGAMYDENVYVFRRTKEHPNVKDLIRRIAETKKEIANFEGSDKVDVEEVPNGEKIAAQKDLSTRAGEIVAMEKTFEEKSAEVEKYEVTNRNFFQIRNDYLKIARELAESTEQLKFWSDSLSRVQMALTLNVGERGMRLSFVQRAPDTITKPSSPTLVKILGAAVALGMFVGVLMIILAELLDHSYRSVEQAIDEIKLPVLGAINEIVSPAAAMRRKILGWGVFPFVTTALALLLTGVFMLAYLSLEKPHQYDQLRENPVRFISQQLTGSL
jgi:uncharacterized protein involved in exopolysaccharide biosynthesis